MHKIGSRFKTKYDTSRFGGSTLKIVSNGYTGTYPYKVEVVCKGDGSAEVGTEHWWRDDGNGSMMIEDSRKWKVGDRFKVVGNNPSNVSSGYEGKPIRLMELTKRLASQNIPSGI